MRSLPGFVGAFWPEPDDELLLHAALDDTDTAGTAWTALAPRFDLDTVGWPQHRLVPLLGRNLAAFGIDAPDLARMQGVRRRTWSENQLWLKEAEHVLSVLADADVSTLLLNGVALLTAFYDDTGVRPMLGVDILVNDRRRALAALAAYGGISIDDRRREPRAGMTVAAPAGRSVGIHDFVSGLAVRGRGRRSWDDVWDASSTTVVGHAKTRLPDPADLLLHVCVHGSQRRVDSYLQWVADATTIIRSSAVDWDRLVRQAQLGHAVLAATETLTYLSSRFSVPVPPPILERLCTTQTTRRDRIVYRARSRVEQESPQMNLPARVFWDYARASSDRTMTGAVIGFVPHLTRRLRERIRAA